MPDYEKLPHITVGKTTFICLFPGIVRRHTPAEREGLARSIEEAGRVENPVIVASIPGGMGVIDGWTRVEIAHEKGLKSVPIMLTPAKDPEEWRRLAIDLNAERRQLTPEEKVKLRMERQQRAVAAHAAGRSKRAIAQQEGVSESQVRKDLKDAASANGVAPAAGPGAHQCAPDADRPGSPAATPPARVKGRDGKEYPAAKVATDAVGIPLSPEMAEAFKVRELFAEARKLHRRLAEVNNLIAQAPGGERFRTECCHYIHSGGDQGRFRCSEQRNAALQIDSLEPHCSVCPTCHAKEPGKVFPKCPSCKGHGWVTKYVFEDKSLPREQREAVLALAKPKAE